MPLAEEPVGSIIDPRFAAEMSYARQICLRTYAVVVRQRRVELPRVLVVDLGIDAPGWMRVDRLPTDIECFHTRVHNLYLEGLRYLGHLEDPRAVELAYRSFQQVSEEFRAQFLKEVVACPGTRG